MNARVASSSADDGNMPHWCEGKMVVTGGAPAVLAFRRANASDARELDFERSVVSLHLPTRGAVPAAPS